ncbi:MAG: hypothetical protein CW338_08185 [Clostridiales bacterium]|nr:hypothetical protein [Clostridiales bacterium]
MCLSKLFKKFGRQFVDVIEWTENNAGTMVYRFDCKNHEIKNGAQLTVRESQNAVMVNEGNLGDVFGPGRFELSTQNMPLTTSLQSWKYGFNSPFKAEVYFVNMHQFPGRKWGTSNPVMMRDPEFGVVRLRAFGTYSFKVKDAVVFMREVFGTSAYMTVDGVSDAVKSRLISGLSDAIAESKIPALDLAANYEELGRYVMQTVSPAVADLGLELCSVTIENISLPAEVERVIDSHTAKGVTGTAQTQPSFGNTGFTAGSSGGDKFNAIGSAPAAEPVPVKTAVYTATGTKVCKNCGAKLAADANFCVTCGTKQ